MHGVTDETTRVILKAASVLVERGWRQGPSKNGKDGVCIMNALYESAEEICGPNAHAKRIRKVYYAASKKVATYLNCPCPNDNHMSHNMRWNDSARRTEQEVERALLRAATN